MCRLVNAPASRGSFANDCEVSRRGKPVPKLVATQALQTGVSRVLAAVAMHAPTARKSLSDLLETIPTLKEAAARMAPGPTVPETRS